MEKYSGTGKISHLFTHDNQMVTHLVMSKDQVLPTHHVDYDVCVIPVKGKVIFSGEAFKQEIVPGDLILMAPNETHSLKALVDSELMVVKSKLQK